MIGKRSVSVGNRVPENVVAEPRAYGDGQPRPLANVLFYTGGRTPNTSFCPCSSRPRETSKM